MVGISGSNIGEISRCMNYGEIKGRDTVGGITRWLDKRKHRDCCDKGMWQ